MYFCLPNIINIIFLSMRISSRWSLL